MHAFYYSLGGFGIMEVLGDIYPGYIANHHCFPVLGCNIGFFGYEGWMHFVSGICVALGLLWAYERGYLRRHTLWSLVGWSGAIAIAWELVEWGYDLVRIHLLDMDLLNPNNLAQPNALDTVGDIVLAVLGTLAVYTWLRYRSPSLVSA